MMKYNAPCPMSRKEMTVDNRIPLPAGSEIISASGIHYKIKEDTVSFGGSALIYRASREGSLRNFILKEFYPHSKKFNFVREGVVIRSANETDAEEYFRLLKENMIRENTIGQLLANKTGRTISALENLNVEKIIVNGESYDATGSYFIVLEEVTGAENRGWFLKDLLEECAKPVQDNAPLRTGGLPSPEVATCIMEELLKALRDVHKAGYVHGDISDANFFLTSPDSKSGDIGVGQLLDFGNAFKIEVDGKTLPIENVFSTSGYWSPEILDNKGALRLTAATDVYSAGCLMLYLLKGMRYKRVYGRNLAKNFSAVTFVSVKKIMQCGYRREAAILFNKILAKALAYNPTERYKDAGEMLKDIIFLKKIVAPPKFNLSPNLSRSPYFVNGSRDKEIARLQSEMDEGKNLLWVHGIGGIGKTELAMEFARKQIEKGRAAYLATFRSSIKETILNLNFSGWCFEFDGQGDASDLEYRARIDLLKENYKDILLIIDNFDDETKSLVELQREPAYKDIISLDMKILFTTRSRPYDSTPELNPLDEESAFTLFKSVTKISLDEESIVRKLIREVDCHPMTVEILAHTLNESWGTISPKELLIRLKDAALNSPTDPEVLHNKGGSVREAKIYTHLRTLFNLFNMDDTYREILCHTTLLPVDGFDASEFILSESDAKKKQLKQLEGRGWLKRRVENNSLWIHPLIRSIFLNELKPTNADCSNFLLTLWKRLDDRYPQEKKLFKQAAELYERAAKDLGDEAGEHHFHAGYCHIVGENFVKALAMEERAVQLQEAIADKTNIDLARTYNDAGAAAGYAQDYVKAMIFFDKAIKFLEANAPENPNTANILSNIANGYLFLGDYDKAVTLGERAVKIFEKTPPKNKHELANAYSIYGNTLLWTKKFAEAEPNFFVASKILEELAPEGSPELAKVYIDLGQLYLFFEDSSPGAIYLLKALNMQEKLLPENHLDKMITCKILSEIYRRIGNLEESKKFSDMAEKIRKGNIYQESKELLELTLDTIELREDKMVTDEFIKCYRTVASAYRKIGKLEQAQKFILSALKKITDTTAADEMYLTYFEASELFSDKKEFDTAVSYAKKGLSILQKSEPDNFSSLSKNSMRLGILCNGISDKVEEALCYFESAIQFQLKSPYPDFDFIRFYKKAIGMTLKELKRFDEAQTVFEKLLEDLQQIFPDSHPEIKEMHDLIDEVRFLKSESDTLLNRDKI